MKRLFLAAALLAGSLMLLRWAISGVWLPADTAQVAETKCEGVVIHPGTTLSAEIAAQPPFTTFCLKAGVHRISTPVIPRSGDKFIGDPGAVINGAVVLTSWDRHDRYWVAYVQTPFHPEPHGTCRPDFPGCRYANDLFVNDQPLQRVLNLDDVRPGRFYVDEATGGIYIGEAPQGRTVELAVSVGGILGQRGIDSVTVRGLIVEKMANRAQLGAIDSRPEAKGWVIEDNEVRLTHGVGICTGSDSRVRRNFVHHNGQLGLCGWGEDILIEENRISFNNVAGFSDEWEAGGGKWTMTNRLILRRNHAHDNKGPGLWTDIDNINTVYEGNRVENNEGPGIYHEISYAAVIRNNVASGNGHRKKEWLWGAGILIAASPNVEMYGNTLGNNGNGIALIQQNRGSGRYGPHELADVWVHDNRVTMQEGMTGLAQDVNDQSYFTTRKIRFARNTYYLRPGQPQFAWNNRAITKDEWQGYGHDTDGTFFNLR